MGLSSAFETLKRAGDSITTKFESIRSNFESAIGTYTGTFGNDLRNGTMTGVNYSGLAEVNTAIESWLELIDQDLAKLEAMDPTVAFKGEQFVDAIKGFIESVKVTCHNVSSNLREFQKIMNDAIAAYQARDTQLKSDISSASESVKSQATEYEQVSHNG